MNFWDIVILLTVGAALALAVRRVRRSRASGGCCGNCASCGQYAACAQRKEETGTL